MKNKAWKRVILGKERDKESSHSPTQSQDQSTMLLYVRAFIRSVSTEPTFNASHRVLRCAIEISICHLIDENDLSSDVIRENCVNRGSLVFTLERDGELSE